MTLNRRPMMARMPTMAAAGLAVMLAAAAPERAHAQTSAQPALGSVQGSVQGHAAAGTPSATPRNTVDRVVYHIDNAAAQATKALRNIRNHLDVAPETEIVVVTHAEGVDFLMEGAKDPRNPNVDYGALVSALKARKVRFEVCEITLKNRNLQREQFSMDADFTPSGVARIGRLQTREGYAYIKP